MDSDFSQLYSQLGLSPQAGVEDLKRAYRRRVGQLHPDRHRNESDAPGIQEEFAELIALYGMAMRFHRAHGRLPGEASAIGFVRPASGMPPDVESTPESRPTTVVEDVGERTLGRRGWLLIGALTLLIALAFFTAPDQTALVGPVPADPGLLQGAAPMLDQVSTAPEKLALGMDMALALTIQGRPSYREGDVWEYGPSWLRFEEGQLVEWYSSPLYQLKVSTPTASGSSEDSGS